MYMYYFKGYIYILYVYMYKQMYYIKGYIHIVLYIYLIYLKIQIHAFSVQRSSFASFGLSKSSSVRMMSELTTWHASPTSSAPPTTFLKLLLLLYMFIY